MPELCFKHTSSSTGLSARLKTVEEMEQWNSARQLEFKRLLELKEELNKDRDASDKSRDLLNFLHWREFEKLNVRIQYTVDS